MNSGLLRPPTVPQWVAAISWTMSLLGLAGLVLTCILGFETPNTALLVTSVALMFGAPLAVLWHLAETDALTTAEKRLWVRELTSAGALTAISNHASPTAERAPEEAEDAAARRHENAAEHERWRRDAPESSARSPVHTKPWLSRAIAARLNRCQSGRKPRLERQGLSPPHRGPGRKRMSIAT